MERNNNINSTVLSGKIQSFFVPKHSATKRWCTCWKEHKITDLPPFSCLSPVFYCIKFFFFLYSLLQGCLEKGMTHPFGNKLQLKKIAAAAAFGAVPQKSCYFGQITLVSSALIFRLKSIRTWTLRHFSRFPPCFSYQLVRTTPTKEKSPMGKDYSSLILSIPSDLNHGTRLGPPGVPYRARVSLFASNQQANSQNKAGKGNKDGEVSWHFVVAWLISFQPWDSNN